MEKLQEVWRMKSAFIGILKNKRKKKIEKWTGKIKISPRCKPVRTGNSFQA